MQDISCMARVPSRLQAVGRNYWTRTSGLAHD